MYSQGQLVRKSTMIPGTESTTASCKPRSSHVDSQKPQIDRSPTTWKASSPCPDLHCYSATCPSVMPSRHRSSINLIGILINTSHPPLFYAIHFSNGLLCTSDPHRDAFFEHAYFSAPPDPQPQKIFIILLDLSNTHSHTVSIVPIVVFTRTRSSMTIHRRVHHHYCQSIPRGWPATMSNILSDLTSMRAG